MAISINWNTKVITVPKADTALESTGPPEVRTLDVDTFRLALRALEDNEAGITYLKTHNHNTEATLGGVTYARQVILVNGYTVTFEDGTYIVKLQGANNNIQENVNYNSVQTAAQNSAGLQIVTQGSGVTEQDKNDITAGVWDESEALVVRKLLENKVTKSGNVITVYEDNGTDVFRTYDLSNGGRVQQ